MDSFVKGSCRVCGRAVGHKNKKALFSVIGLRDRIAERLSQLSGLSVLKDDLSEFACKKCVSNLDTFTRMQIQSEKLKTELINAMMETTLRHRSALRWRHATTCPVIPSVTLHPSGTLTRSPSQIPRPKRALPITPRSSNKPTPKHRRLYHPLQVQGESPLCSHPIARTLFEEGSSERQNEQLAQPLPGSSNSTSSNSKIAQQNIRQHIQKVPVKVEIGYTKTFTALLDNECAPIGKNLARKRYKSFCKAVLKHPHLAKLMLLEVGNLIRGECTSLVSTDTPSVLRRKGKSQLSKFEWGAITSEWETRAPSFLMLLTAAADKTWHRRKEGITPQCIPALCLAGAVLLKTRNKHMSAVQTVISLLLNAGHVSSQTYTRLNKVGLCLSHQQTLNVIDRLAGDHDHLIQKWKALIEKKEVTVPELEHRHHRPELTPLSKVVTESQSSQSTQEVESQGGDISHENGFPDRRWKIVGDNLDMMIKVRDMRQDNPNQSYHFFQAIAVQDRIGTSHLDDTKPQCLISTLGISHFVPSQSEYQQLRSDLIVLLARILVAEFPQFRFMSNAVPKHISHQYSSEMAEKSIVTPLGVIMKNENISSEMIEIMQALHKYVPSNSDSTTVDGVQRTEVVQSCLFGGDQLTAARARGAKRHRQDSATGWERLDGLEPVIEDWHAKMCLFEVVFKRYFNGQSTTDGGTLWHLRCLTKRHNISKDVSKKMNELEDFFHSLAKAHVIAASMHFFSMENKADKPTLHQWSASLSMSSTDFHWKYLSSVLGTFVDEYIMPSLMFTLDEENVDVNQTSAVQNYALSFLSDLMIVENFKDIVHEGDGDRMLYMWKFLLLYFRATGHTKYAYESVNLVAQASSLLSECSAHRLKWSRFVNTRGTPGHNISCDLAMEHWNRAFKQHLYTAGGNVSSSTIRRTGMALATLESICSSYDLATHITPPTVRHATKSAQKDENTMVDALHNKYKVFIADHSHSKFPHFPRNHFARINKIHFKRWIQDHIAKFSKLQSKQMKLLANGPPQAVNSIPISHLSLLCEMEDEWEEF